MRTLGVVCARAGSVRLPNKHLLTLGGEPIVETAIKTALGSSSLNYVAVSTDDASIRALVEERFERELATPESLFLRNRPAALATNEAPIEGVLLDALEQVEAHIDPDVWFDAVVFLPGNVVFLDPGQIDACVKKLDGCPEATAAMTVRQAKEPPEWMWVKEDSLDGELSPAFDFSFLTGLYRMQDMPKRFLATGAVNAVRAKTLRENQAGGAFKWLGDRILGVIDDKTLEIHTAEDYDYAAWKWGAK